MLKFQHRTRFDSFIRSKIDQYVDFRIQSTRIRFTKDLYPFALNLETYLGGSGDHLKDFPPAPDRAPSPLSLFDVSLDLVRSEWIPWSEL